MLEARKNETHTVSHVQRFYAAGGNSLRKWRKWHCLPRLYWPTFDESKNTFDEMCK